MTIQVATRKPHTLCRTVCFCNQQWQDTVAPCHCSTCSWSWLIHCQSHWWSWVQMGTRPHSWTSPRCCQAWHTPQGWSGWTTCHHSINLRSCTGYSKHLLLLQYNHLLPHNTQASCSPKPYSSNLHPVEDTCNCRCSTSDWQNCCRTLLIWSCQ